MASTTEFMMELRPKAMGNADQQAHDVVTTSYARWVDKFQLIYAHAKPYRTGDSNGLKTSLTLPYGSFISFTDYFLAHLLDSLQCITIGTVVLRYVM